MLSDRDVDDGLERIERELEHLWAELEIDKDGDRRARALLSEALSSVRVLRYQLLHGAWKGRRPLESRDAG